MLTYKKCTMCKHVKGVIVGSFRCRVCGCFSHSQGFTDEVVCMYRKPSLKEAFDKLIANFKAECDALAAASVKERSKWRI